MSSAARDTRFIARLYSPLAASWLLMGLEGPACTIAIARTSAPHTSDVQLAAYLLLIEVAMMIESPVIDLLSTSTAFARGRKSVKNLDHYAMIMMLVCGLAHAIVAFTPLYDAVAFGMLKAPHAVGEAGRMGMRLMLLWSPAIGWRRHRQGLLIRAGETKAIGFGTMVRLSCIATSLSALSFLTPLRGVTMAAVALQFSVVAESVFVHVMSLGIAREHLSGPEPQSQPTPGLQRLFKFHGPLVLTTLATLVQLPILMWGIDLLANPVLNLAALQVVYSVNWLFRSVTYAVPEVVLALYERTSKRVLGAFCMRVGVWSTLIAGVCAATRLDVFVFSQLMGTDQRVSEIAHWAFIVSCLWPIVTAAQSFFRGLIAAIHATMARVWAIGAAIVATLLAVEIGRIVHGEGMAVAMNAAWIGLLAELATLVVAYRILQRRLVPAVG